MPTATRPRITPDMSPAEKQRAVRRLLRELAAVLHAARREKRPTPWLAAHAVPAPAAAEPAAAV